MVITVRNEEKEKVCQKGREREGKEKEVFQQLHNSNIIDCTVLGSLLPRAQKTHRAVLLPLLHPIR
jgi:hypothetical protein